MAITDSTVFDLESLEQLVLDVIHLARETKTTDASARMRALLLKICCQTELYVPVVEPSPLRQTIQAERPSHNMESDPVPTTTASPAAALIPAILSMPGKPLKDPA
jgi:hypothetical protein